MSENELDISNELAELLFVALDHGIDSVRASGGPLIPFVMTEASEPEGRQLHRFEAEKLEECIGAARSYAASLSNTNVSRCVLAYDGLVTIQGTKYDAIMVEAMERGQPTVILAQRYTPKKFWQKFATIGNAAYVGKGQPLF
jgi:hypothetical protein